MKIEDYLESLPQGIISGEDVQLPDRCFREIFDFVGLGADDVFCHLGCGNGRGIGIAAGEYNVRRARGIDISSDRISEARAAGIAGAENSELVCGDVTEQEYGDATVILFWFTEERIVEAMARKFQELGPGCRIITVLDPLPGFRPDQVRFPYIVHSTPLTRARDLREQVLAVFGVECIDFVTSWEHAERYTRAIGDGGAGNDRFLTIMQSVMMWINARNLGVACGREVPESVKTYISILREFFNIEVEHLLKK